MAVEEKNQKELENLRRRVKLYLTSNKMAQNTLAEKLDINKSALSTTLSGSYAGKIEDVIKKITTFLDKEEQKLTNNIKKIEYIDTSISTKIEIAIREAEQDEKIAVILGPTGIGKSFFLKHFCNEIDASVIYIEADETYTIKSLLNEIKTVLKIDEKIKTTSALMKSITEKLKTTKRTIVIDEAERLSIKILSVLRKLHDKAGVAIIFCGLPVLFTDIISQYQQTEPFHSRIYKTDLGKLTKEDTTIFVKEVLPKIENDLIDFIHQISKQVTVYIVNILLQIQREMNKRETQTVTKEIIIKATENLVIL
ncbi:MAG: hypothetical protein A2086_17255 [Spirochaetes bacterium GWD1_27_9]|nr:MAG: hypothetical protein A2Z98_12420 [Spirochaetes bacterium GWB1_27_13]OHD42469.1 MAG: hypothetical protein A2086_17255 [Spirochaetes bacterium GWD1_27_9]